MSSGWRGNLASLIVLKGKRAMEEEGKKHYNRVLFRAAEVEEPLSARSAEQTEKGYSQVAKRDLKRLYSLYGQSLPRFSLAEAMTLATILQGAKNAPETVHLLWAEVDGHLAEQHAQGVNRGAFVARLRNLSRFECMAIADAIERAWNAPTYHIDDLPARLRHVGLVEEEQNAVEGRYGSQAS